MYKQEKEKENYLTSNCESLFIKLKSVTWKDENKIKNLRKLNAAICWFNKDEMRTIILFCPKSNWF